VDIVFDDPPRPEAPRFVDPNIKRRKETVGSVALITAQYLIERGDRSDGRWRYGALRDLELTAGGQFESAAIG
jgi:hypothetical protein